tara:strand:- start:5897 stop:6154 length:258 start_codon:yes stop_codon:yes gene_type:complete
MDFNKIVVYAVGIASIIALATTMSDWIPSQAEFNRETRSNKKAITENKIRTIERELCLTGDPDELVYCMLSYSRYEALREREDYR